MKKHVRYTLPLLVALGVAFLPALARADMAFPATVFILSWLHLVIGNSLIGLAEGWLIARIFKTKLTPSILFMVVANYFSAWMGFFVVQHWRVKYNWALVDHFDHARALLWGVWAVFFAGTLVLEWPFCFLIFLKAEHRWRKSLLALLLSQSASYAVLLALYLMAGDTSLVTDTKNERSFDFVKDKKAWVYYLSPSCDAIWRRRLDGSPPQEMIKTHLHDRFMDLKVAFATDGKGQDIWLSHTPGFNASSTYRLMLRNVTEPARTIRGANADTTQILTYNDKFLDEDSTRALSGMRIDGGVQPASPNNAGYLYVCRESYDPRRHQWNTDGTVKTLCLETPLAIWQIGRPLHLSGGQAVFEMGDYGDYKTTDLSHALIVILDAQTLQLAVIARGSSPVAVLEGN